jgi:RNA polymerase sigma factor for flagellar operon FliA
MTSTSARSDGIKAYKQAQKLRDQSKERDDNIVRHLPLVHSVVERIAAHLPAVVDRDDLFHAGVIGLIDALNRFDASRDNAFSTYAVMRIRGQIIDDLRARDWIPRSARNRAKEYQHAVNALTQKVGRLPTDQELAAFLEVSEDELVTIEKEAQLSMQISLDAPSGEDGEMGSRLSRNDDEWANPARNLERDDQRKLLAELLTTLTEQERMIVKLYYFENLLMKEIAEVLGVTESRICQIHSRIIVLLRSRLGHRDSLW